MTYFLKDILRQPEELQRTLAHLCGAGFRALQTAVTALRAAPTVYLTGIGSSWHAAICARPLFYVSGLPVVLQEGCDLLHLAPITRQSAIIAVSRSGRSVEIVQLLAKAREQGAIVIGITSSEGGPLARESSIPIVVPVGPDHGISVNTYSALAAAAGALACAVAGHFDDALVSHLLRGVEETAKQVPCWQAQVAAAKWATPGATTYFLGRGSSLGTCQEARLLWEEGAKSPATAMGTGSFRHGPQEIVSPGMRFGVWLDAKHMREQDLAVVRDLTHLGADVMLVGQDICPNDAASVFRIPRLPASWQFLVDVIPAQLSAEHLARLSGVDADSFRFCSYIVEEEFGLFPRTSSSLQPRTSATDISRDNQLRLRKDIGGTKWFL